MQAWLTARSKSKRVPSSFAVAASQADSNKQECKGRRSVNVAGWVQVKAVPLTVCGFSQPLQAAPQLSKLTAQLVDRCSLRVC